MEPHMIDLQFARQLEGYGLTTAEIMYHMPDHPGLLQTFIWQQYDQAPKFPVLYGFLDFWKREIDGPLHSVTVAYRQLIAPNEWRTVQGIELFH
jgi:uncharacterized protein Usg